MNPISLAGKRILFAQAKDPMGPTLVLLLTELGATAITDDRALLDPELPAELVCKRGSRRRADSHLMSNRSCRACRTPPEPQPRDGAIAPLVTCSRTEKHRDARRPIARAREKIE